jgi:hypothetical protein
MKLEQVIEIASKVSEALDGEEVTRETVLAYLNEQLPAVVHNDRVTKAFRDGWTAGHPGDKYDEDKKIDPDLVVYGNASPAVVSRDDAVYAVVRALRFYIGSDDPHAPVIPPGLQGNMTPKQKEQWEEMNDTKLPDSVIRQEPEDSPEEEEFLEDKSDDEVADENPQGNNPDARVTFPTQPDGTGLNPRATGLVSNPAP